jgi:hypothetical protein
MLIDNRKLHTAITSISRRSEKELDDDKIVISFVDPGIVREVQNRNANIVFGRRGTGKTHLFKFLVSEYNKKSGTMAVYIDMRSLGSTAPGEVGNYNPKGIGYNIFIDILSEVHNKLSEVNETLVNGEKQTHLYDALEEIEYAILGFDSKVKNGEVKKRKSEISTSKAGVSASLNTTGFGVEGSLTSEEKEKGILEYTEVSGPRMVKKVVQDAFNKAFKVLGIIDFQIFLDEWSSLGTDIQPFLADYLKNVILPIPFFTVNIATLPYRTEFLKELNGRSYGFELGGDVYSVDLDSFFIVDAEPQRLYRVSLELLQKHVLSEMPTESSEDFAVLNSTQDFKSSFFTSDSTFVELVRASGGIPRELIIIFARSYLDTIRRERKKIDIKSIMTAAQHFFDNDKGPNLSEGQKRLLGRIMNVVIGDRSARSFLVPDELDNNEVLQGLYDKRVIHRILRGYSDKDSPGKRYNIYTLDYGTYVKLKSTSKEPKFDFLEEGNFGEDFVVPFDDNRKIRRIVLDEKDLSVSN